MGEISVWVKGHQKQIGGVSHKTSAVEIVSFVLSECVWSTTEKARRSGRCYALFENWRGCQRLIPPWKRIYKLWKLWGLERIHVKFVVRKVAMETLARKDFGEYVEASQLKVPKRHVALRMEPHVVANEDSEYTSSSDGFGLYLLNESDADGKSPKTRRKRTLLKQVVRQNEKLHDITRTVDDVDEEILFYEAKLHHYRVVEGGKDYVQEAYLAEQEKRGLHKLQVAPKSPSSIKSDDTTVSINSKEGVKQNVQYSSITDERTLNDNGREDVVDQNANIDENSRRKLGNPEAILGKKNGTKILVVNPLPRDDNLATKPEQGEHESLKADDVLHHHHHDGKKGIQVYGGGKPSFRSTKRMHKHGGGRVKKRMPGLYEFEQSCEWLKVMDKELKRLESLENLSFVDWDSESLLSDKELTICGNRKFKFRNGFSSKNRKPTPSVATNKSTEVTQLNDNFSDLQLEQKAPVLGLDEKKSQGQEKDRVADVPKTVGTKGIDLASTNLELLKDNASTEMDTSGSGDGAISAPTKASTVSSFDHKLTGKESECELLPKKKMASPVRTKDGNKETSGNSTPDEGLSSKRNVKRGHVSDNSNTTSSRASCAKQILPQPVPAVSKRNSQVCKTRGLEKSNPNSAPRFSLTFSSREKSHLKQNDRSGNVLNVQRAEDDHRRVQSSMNVLTTCQNSEARSTVSHKVGAYHKAVPRNRPVAEVETGKHNDEHARVSSLGNAVNGEIKVPHCSVPEPQSSPVSIRRVPKPPIYYPSEDHGAVRHSPTHHKQTLSRNSLKDAHGGQRHRSVAVGTSITQKVHFATALHPRVEQLRTCKLNGQVLSAVAMTPAEVDPKKPDSLRKDLHNFISDKNMNHHDDITGKTNGNVGRKHVYFEDEQPPLRKPFVHSTPIKSNGLTPNTSRVRSPDQGLGQEIPSPADRSKCTENADSGSDTGLSSVHSQDSGISNASVVIETWV